MSYIRFFILMHQASFNILWIQQIHLGVGDVQGIMNILISIMFIKFQIVFKH